jgi:hypothetical protein
LQNIALTVKDSQEVDNHRVHREWERPLSGVHSIMIEKLAQAVEGGGVHAQSLSLFTITYKVAV